MPASLRLLALVPALVLASTGRAAPVAAAAPGAAEPAPRAAPAPGADSDADAVARMRFGWTSPLRARVTYRRTRLRPAAAPSVFTARYETRVGATPDGLALTTHRTTWRGDLPFPRALEKDAIRASEAIVQRIEREGRFAGLDGVEAMRPVLARVFEDAKVPPDAAARAMPLAEAALRAEAEELWNLAVGFWSGADLRVGERYALASEGEIPLVPGTRAAQQVEFAVRRRVPCAAAERASRCVEATLRQTPDRAALEHAAEPLLARLLPAGAARPEGAAGELGAEGELVLVTDPATLLPRRLVWTKAVRLGAGDDGPVREALVDRTEYDWTWLPPEPPRKAAPARRRPAPAPAAPESRTPAGDPAAAVPAAPSPVLAPAAAADAAARSP